MNLLTVKEVSARLKTGKSTIYEWAALGLIPCVKVNGLLRFDEAELEAWVEGFKRPARAEGGLVSRLASKAVEAAAGGAVAGIVKSITGGKG